MALENIITEVAENPFYSLAYNKFLSEKKFMGSKCKQCGNICVPPRPICSKCRNDDMELVEMKGDGKLVAYTVISVGPPMMVEEGFDRNNQYCCGVVEFESGARITARILGLDVSKPEEIKIGTSVTVEFVEAEHGGETKTFLAFKALP